MLVMELEDFAEIFLDMDQLKSVLPLQNQVPILYSHMHLRKFLKGLWESCMGMGDC